MAVLESYSNFTLEIHDFALSDCAHFSSITTSLSIPIVGSLLSNVLRRISTDPLSG